MALRIAEVLPDSLAARAGIQAGDVLERINGVPVLDSVDYQYLTASALLRMDMSRDGVAVPLVLEKRADAQLGLTLEDTLMSCPKRCANDCVFCFVAQLPSGLRPSLYVKDDDWRLSLMTGNFITLTNLPEREIARIIARKASPLYLSVHTTDGALRARMLRNPNATRILPLLRRFVEAGIAFHGQIVLCPGINDGEALERTLADLLALAPMARSVALVPVGLTRHRDGLTALTGYDAQGAARVLDQAERWQTRALAAHGTRFVFPADELYQLAGRTLPPYEAYEDFAQIENGVGLLRQLAHEFDVTARLDPEEDTRPRRVAIATGTSAAPFLRALIASQPLHGVQATVYPIVNRFFGDTVTCAGLVTGGDLMTQLTGVPADELLIPDNMLRAGEAVFLDDTPLTQVEAALGIPVRVIPADGAALLYALRGTEEA